MSSGSSDRYPFSDLPTGWFVVATSDELLPGQVTTRRYFDRDLVLFRTESGDVAVSDAHCPHMGAHLGDGRVEGETLRCPFHAFRFDREGSCVATGYGKGLPRRAKLHTWPVQERSGLVLVWHDADGKPPHWEVPALPVDSWSRLRCRRLEVDSHPQETSENSIDFGHFTAVHNFHSAEMTQEVKTDGPLLRSAYSVMATLGAIGLPQRTVRGDFEVEVWGLGYSLVNLWVEAFGVHARLFVLPIPLDEEHIDLRLACSTNHRSPIISVVLREIIARTFWKEVGEDIPIWTRKKYLATPALAPGDGPITLYRKWAAQFYPER